MPPNLKILQLNSGRKYIGEAAHTLNLTEALRQRGHQVWLGLRAGYLTMERAEARNLAPIGFHMPHRWWPPQDMRDLRKIARLVRTHKIDLIHAHRGKDHWQAVLANRLFRLNVPVIRTRHVVTPLKADIGNRWLAKRTAVMVVVSRAVQEDVQRTELYPPPRLVFIPGGIDLKKFAPPSAEAKAAAREKLAAELAAQGVPNALAKQPLLVFCVARFAKVKAHPVLLNAWKQALPAIPTARLVLVGDGHLRASAEALTDALGLRESVWFMGTRNDIPELLQAADAGVLSSIGSEGFSRAVLEYMAMGLPTIASRVGAVPDLLEDGCHGALVEPNDAAALSAGLQRVLNAPAQTQRAWGEAARQKALTQYGFDRWAQSHEKLYAQILEQA